MYRLKNAGFAACLVGGCVRDMLLGREPKDFDVATDARPEQVRSIFRNCRLVGRRFRLAHVHFGSEIIEVATFRAQHDGDEEGGLIEGGRIIRDNVYGTIEEDARRRDFSVNALYYDIDGFSVIDYTGGAADLDAGVLRLIGDPAVRYREDPVRMLRAARFAAKLGFRVHPESEAPLWELGPLLREIPPSRLFEEVLKLFLKGGAVETFELLRHYDLFGHLFPMAEDLMVEEHGGYPLAVVKHALAGTDQRVVEEKPVTPAFLFAALLWAPMRRAARRLEADGLTETQALQQAARDTLLEQGRYVMLPRRFAAQVREIWLLQPRLEHNSAKRAERLAQHPRFRAAYDFLLLRAAAGEDLAALCEWWTRFQEAGIAAGPAVSSVAEKPARRRRRGGRRRRRGNGVERDDAAPGA